MNIAIVLLFAALYSATQLSYVATASPIFSVEVDRLKSRDNRVTLLHYIDIAENIKEYIDLNCETPSATKYDWNIYAKLGAPYATHMSLGKPSPKNVDMPFMTTIRQQEYPWQLLLVTCDVYLEGIGNKDNDMLLLTYAWVILKMKSSTDRPFHPTICAYNDAQCVKAKIECVYDKRGLLYMGRHDRTDAGITCQPWYSKVPNHGWGLRGTDATTANHNYCRNEPSSGKGHPFCIWNVDKRVDPAAAGSTSIFKICNIPKCHDCMYGSGNGEFPDAKSYTGDLADYYRYPTYSGNSGFTNIQTVNSHGKTTYRKCHRGKSDFWKENNCRLNPKVGRRRASSNSNKLRCLGIPDVKRDETDFSEDPFWDRFKWVDCVVPQCTVRQVWFLLVTDENKLLLTSDNSRHVEITVLDGQTKTIKFFHFGTNLCKGMSFGTERKLQPYLNSFTMKCRPTPQKSEFVIRSPTRDYAGDYNLMYTFTEGDEHVESIVYKMNFKLVVKTPTTISLSKTEVCPGYPSQTLLNVHGSFKLDTDSIRWYYRDSAQNNGDNWSPIEDLPNNNYELSTDAHKLKLKRLNSKMELRVNAKDILGNDVATRHNNVNILAQPLLIVREPNIVAIIDEPIEMAVQCDSNAKTTWIFENQIINSDRGVYSIRSAINQQDERMRTEMLGIRTFRPSHEGIYTIVVEKDKCRTSKDIYVTKE